MGIAVEGTLEMFGCRVGSPLRKPTRDGGDMPRAMQTFVKSRAHKE